MSEAWIDLTAAAPGSKKQRYPLPGGLFRIGGRTDADIPIEGTDGDQLHFWSDPAKVILVGEHSTPLLNGKAFEEAEIQAGDSIQWCGLVIVYGCKQAVVIEELPSARSVAPRKPKAPPRSEKQGVATRGAAARAVSAQPSGAPWALLKSGLLVDLGVAHKGEAKRWQEAIKRGEFDPAAAARDILASSDLPEDDPRLLERAGRLQRDLLMSPLLRGVQGASRAARTKVRGGSAFLIAQAVAILVYTLIIVLSAIFMRLNYDTDFTGIIDGIIEFVTPA